MGFFFAGEVAEQRQRERKHHDGRGRIAHPGAEDEGGEHDAAEDGMAAVADVAKDSEGQAAVQVVAFDSAREKKSAHKEVDERVGVGVGEFGIAENAGSAKEDKREQRGDSEREHFGEPPEEHPEGGSEDDTLFKGNVEKLAREVA